MGLQIGTRDIPLNQSSQCNDQWMEFYWDIILLIESQFLCATITTNQFKQFRKFYLINNVSLKLNQKCDKLMVNWREMGDYYHLLYYNLPIHNGNNSSFLWCKQSNNVMNIIVPKEFKSCFHYLIKKNQLKNWLISLIELTDKKSCEQLILYLNRDLDWNDIKSMMKDINWIGGKIILNENRDNFNDLSLDNYLLTDENFIILQFDA